MNLILAAMLLAPPFARAQEQPRPAQPSVPAPASAPTTRAAATQPDEATMTLAQLQAATKLKAEEEAKTLPVVKFGKIQDVVRLSLKDDNLVLDTTMKQMDDSLAVIPGVAGLTKVRRMDVPRAPEPTPMLVNYENVRFDSPDAVTVQTVASYTPGRLTLSRLEGLPGDEMRHIQLIQSDQYQQDTGGGIMMYVQITGANSVKIELTAKNFVDLRRRYPIETARYLDPIFKTLGQEAVFARVDPKLAWQVFADAYRPTTDEIEKTNAVVAALAAEDFKKREAASEALKQLGQPAAILLMKTDRKGLNDEQIARIDAFLAAYKPVEADKAPKMRKNPNFLLDCLYSDDAAIRKLALAELQKVTGKPIAFNVDAPLETRIETVAKIRESLSPATQPAGVDLKS